MNAFINKTIKIAKKHLLKGTDPREVDRYLRVRRSMFNKSFPGNQTYFNNIINYSLRRQFDSWFPILP